MEINNIDDAIKWLAYTFEDKYKKLEYVPTESDLLTIVNNMHRLEDVCYPCINEKGNNVGCPNCPESWFTINVASTNYYKKMVFVDKPCSHYKSYLLKQKIAENIENSGLASKQNCKLDNYETSNKNDTALQSCHNYLNNYEHLSKDGVGLYLHGVSGTGKTHLACGVGNALLEKGQEVKFISTTSLHNTYKSLMNNDSFEAYVFIEELSEFSGLLILDDIGTEVSTERVNETMYTIVNTRYDLNLPTIYTSNFPVDKLVNRYKNEDGIKIVDRITGRNVDIPVLGTSYRKQELQKLLKGG
jgi:DNA replication protein DnaC